MYPNTFRMLALINSGKANPIYRPKGELEIQVSVTRYSKRHKPEVRVYLIDDADREKEIELNMKRAGESWTYIFGSDASYATIELGMYELEAICSELLREWRLGEVA